MYELTDAMIAKSKLPSYAGAMAACWETTAAALEAQALVTLWRAELASEPGGKEDEAMVQRSCYMYDNKKWLRSRAAHAHHDASDAEIAAVAEWRAEVDDSDAAWVDWPGGARHHEGSIGAFYTPWEITCKDAWRNAQALFDKQSKVMEPFCQGCHRAHEDKAPISRIKVVGSSEITAYTEGI